MIPNPFASGACRRGASRSLGRMGKAGRQVIEPPSEVGWIRWMGMTDARDHPLASRGTRFGLEEDHTTSWLVGMPSERPSWLVVERKGCSPIDMAVIASWSA